MIKYKFSLITVMLLFFTAGTIYPQNATMQKMFLKHQQLLDTLKTKNIHKTTYVAAPFILSGIVLYNSGKKFQDLRDEFAPKFSRGWDDYIQYSSTLMLYGIKIGGIKGRSSWRRLLTTHALSAVTMAVLVNGIKYTVQEPRPNGHGNDSYPSGHTALAFMSANMVHHEFGLTISPWYSIGAYSLATATAIMRGLNNKHYLPDVVLGAGIGILSTELGYLFSDLIFREKGILMPNKDFGFVDIDRPTSFVGLTIGFNKLLNNIPITSSVKLRSSWGNTSGVEGAYYFNKHWGFGANASVYTAPTNVVLGNSSFTGPDLAWYSIVVGPYYSIHVTNFCRFGGKLNAGYSRLLERNFNDYTIASTKGLNLATGIFIEQHITQGMLIKLYANLEKTFFGESRFNLFNVVSGASVSLDLGVVGGN